LPYVVLQTAGDFTDLFGSCLSQSKHLSLPNYYLFPFRRPVGFFATVRRDPCKLRDSPFRTPFQFEQWLHRSNTSTVLPGNPAKAGADGRTGEEAGEETEMNRLRHSVSSSYQHNHRLRPCARICGIRGSVCHKLVVKIRIVRKLRLSRCATATAQPIATLRTSSVCTDCVSRACAQIGCEKAYPTSSS
jgi:hypothetical protein